MSIAVARREKKALVMAWIAFSAGIPAAAMSRATDHEWDQLTEAANAHVFEATGVKGTFGTPSLETRALIVKLMWVFQKTEVAA